MKQGRTLQQLAGEVQRREREKRDFVADSRQIEVTTQVVGEEPFSRLTLGDIDDTFGMETRAIRQLGAFAQIPAGFAERLRRDYPSQFDDTINAIIQREHKKRMVRTLFGRARAVLSDAYEIRDNYELLNFVLPVLNELPHQPELASCQVTDNKLYLKFTFPTIEREVKVDEPVRSGFLLSNSEVGMGRTEVKGFVEILKCTNGMVVPDWSLRKVHLGGRKGTGEDDEAWEIFSDETKQKIDEAFFAKMRDAVRAVADEARFEKAIEKFRESTEREIEGDVPKAVEELTKRSSLTQDEGSAVLRHLIAGGDLSQWGLSNAVTRTASGCDSYDRATELETLGGRIITMSDSDWRAISRN